MFHNKVNLKKNLLKFLIFVEVEKELGMHLSVMCEKLQKKAFFLPKTYI